MIFGDVIACRSSNQTFVRYLLLASVSTCYSLILSNMREIKVSRPSVFSTSTSDGEDQNQPSIFTNDERVSSKRVQCTPEIEKTYVHRVYDAIAPHFSSTRFAKWPKVAAFLGSLPRGSLILDAGCGNGKYLGLNPDCFFIGCDISAPLVNICVERGHEAMVADAVNLPYRTSFGDAAISIAVLHHLSTESRRKRAIEELVRVVKKGGLVLITVWAVEQEDQGLLTKWTPLSHKYLDQWIGPGTPRVDGPRVSNLESICENEDNDSQGLRKDASDSLDAEMERNVKISDHERDTSVNSNKGRCKENQQEFFVPWHLPYHRAEVSGASASAVANGLATKDDKKGAVVYNRYYHVFSEGELDSLVSGMSNTVIVDRFFDKSNWCIVLEKKQ